MARNDDVRLLDFGEPFEFLFQLLDDAPRLVHAGHAGGFAGHGIIPSAVGQNDVIVQTGQHRVFIRRICRTDGRNRLRLRHVGFAGGTGRKQRRAERQHQQQMRFLHSFSPPRWLLWTAFSPLKHVNFAHDRLQVAEKKL